MRIFKFDLEITEERISKQVIEMPIGARILCVQIQGEDRAYLWALVNENSEYEKRQFLVVGTGQEFDPHFTTYIGTVQIGCFVWHVFEQL